MRYGKADRLRSLEVDHELEFRRLLNRHLGRISASENAIDIIGGPAPQIDRVGRIGRQQTSADHRSRSGEAGETMVLGETHDRFDVRGQDWRYMHNQGLRQVLREGY